MKPFVIVPTYNEALNISRLIREIAALGVPGLRVIVVDDNSPDGTAKTVAALTKEGLPVTAVNRIDERGRGTAGIVGFDLALKWGADAVIEMDADFSHPPSVIPRLLAALKEADIAIASRMHPSSVDHRPLARRIITRLGNAYARFFLELPNHRSRVLDWTTGFRAYRGEVFERVPTKALFSPGPSILQETLFRALNEGFSAKEIGFEMPDRERGASTFSRKVARQSLLAIPCYRVLLPQGRKIFLLDAFETATTEDGTVEVRRKNSAIKPQR